MLLFGRFEVQVLWQSIFKSPAARNDVMSCMVCCFCLPFACTIWTMDWSPTFVGAPRGARFVSRLPLLVVALSRWLSLALPRLLAQCALSLAEQKGGRVTPHAMVAMSEGRFCLEMWDSASIPNGQEKLKHFVSACLKAPCTAEVVGFAHGYSGIYCFVWMVSIVFTNDLKQFLVMLITTFPIFYKIIICLLSKDVWISRSSYAKKSCFNSTPHAFFVYH